MAYMEAMSAKPSNEITEERLKTLVELFYERVRLDPLIGPVFNGAIHDWPEHLERLQAFWSSVMLGSGRYKGRPLPAHVQHGDSIRSASFDRWLQLWKEASEEVVSPQAAAALQEKAARIAESLSLGIAFARGEMKLAS
jgi:hemoglobin